MKNKKIDIKLFALIILINFFIISNLYAEKADYKLEAIKILYKNNNDTVIAEGDAIAKDQFGKIISADKIVYFKSKGIIETFNNSKYEDSKGNTVLAQNFLYDINLKKLTAFKNVEYYDKAKNQFFFSKFEYFENSETGYGKDFKGRQNDQSTMEGPFLQINNKKGITVLNIDNFKNRFKGNNENRYTTCKKDSRTKKNIKERCPDWSITSSRTIHDSNTKMVYHNHAFINLRNIPVFYTPYFSHPDPTVDRKSGFLTPSTKNFNNLGRTIKSPYFWAIDERSDLTFTPIFYQDENSIFLADYRLQNKNSNLILDTSYSAGYKNINKKGDGGENLQRTSGSRNHLFAKYLGSYNDLIFRENELELNLQRISQKNYLNVNQINTSQVKQDIQSLYNNFIFTSYESNRKLKISANIYENLSIDDPNTKYQYKLPHVEYNSFFDKYDQNIILNNSFYASNYDGDTKQISQINIIETESERKVFKKIGLSNTLKTKFSQINLYNEQVLNAKENFNSDINTVVGIESSLPLGRFENKTEEIINPRVFVKYSPGKMDNDQSNQKILSYSDIYSIDRMNSLTNPETGLSLGYGFDYEFIKKNLDNITFLSSKFSIGQILSDKKNQEISTTSSLNEKSSNFVGDFNFFFNKAILNNNEKKNFEKKFTKDDFEIDEGINLQYMFNLSNDLNKILKNEIKITHKDEKNLFQTNYYELHDIGNAQSIEGIYKRNIKDEFNIILKAKKNLEKSYSENNSIEINYDSDCLKIGLNLSKTFYESEDLKSDNNLTLFLMLKPFGQPVAPDLTNLINNN